ncbi:TetR/AcrR family transcriptional regulator [Luteibacter sp. PPL552]
MANTSPPSRRDDALSKDRIVDAAIALLDAAGESGLTFRALSERLATGPGAIYWHVANKADLIKAACDAVMSRALIDGAHGTTPVDRLRAVALAVFGIMDRHAWVGPVLARAPAEPPAIRLLEHLGQPLVALDVPEGQLWPTANALLSYIVGVAGQNAANAQFARTHKLRRSAFLDDIAVAWSRLDPGEYPFVRRMAAVVAAHDDRDDFLAGVDLILDGIQKRRGS